MPKTPKNSSHCKPCTFKEKCRFVGECTPSPREPTSEVAYKLKFRGIPASIQVQVPGEYVRCIYNRCSLGERRAVTAVLRAARAIRPTAIWTKEIVDGKKVPVIPVISTRKDGYMTPKGEFVVKREGSFYRTGQVLSERYMVKARPYIKTGLKRYNLG